MDRNVSTYFVEIARKPYYVRTAVVRLSYGPYEIEYVWIAIRTAVVRIRTTVLRIRTVAVRICTAALPIRKTSVDF